MFTGIFGIAAEKAFSIHWTRCSERDWRLNKYWKVIKIDEFINVNFKIISPRSIDADSYA